MHIPSFIKKTITFLALILINNACFTAHTVTTHAITSSVATAAPAFSLEILNPDLCSSILKPGSFLVACNTSPHAPLPYPAPLSYPTSHPLPETKHVSTHANLTRTSNSGTPTANKIMPEKIIILDLNNFISENSSTITSKIGLSTLGSYIVTHWRSPITCCLDTLEKMGNDAQHASDTELLYKDRRMPHCVVSWQQGSCSYNEVKKALFDYIEELDKTRFFKSAQEKKLAQDIISMVLNPEELEAITKPVPTMIKLAQELKQKGFKLYAIANLAQEAHTQIKKTYPEIIELFDGIIVSSHAQVLKNDKRLLEKLLTSYNLVPAHCTLIDQDKKTIATAEQLGIQTIVFTKQQNLRALLKKRGIL